MEGRITNNSAEIEAVIEAAKVAKENGINKIRINTDSAFLINCQTKWIKKWKARGWTTSSNKPVLNKVELQKMDKVLSELDVEFVSLIIICTKKYISDIYFRFIFFYTLLIAIFIIDCRITFEDTKVFMEMKWLIN